MLSQTTKIFTVWSDELEGILSPHFFISKPNNQKGFTELKELAIVNPTRRKPSFADDELVPYVGLPETNDREIQEVVMRPYKEVKGRNIIKKGDILFARIEPSVFNKKYIFVEDLHGHDFAFTSTEFYIVEPKTNINSLFLFNMFFAEPVYNQVIGKTTGSTGRRRLDKGVFEKIFIPYPPKDLQDKVVSYLQDAYEQKQKKEDEIKKILASIDNLVLSELSVEFERERVGVSVQIWQIWSDVIERRLDPMFFHPMRMLAVKAIRNAKASVIPLSKIVKFRRELVSDIPENVTYIGLENIVSNSGEYIKTNAKESISSAFVFKKGDILFPKLRPYLNKVYYADFDGICSTEFHIFEVEKCDPYFLFIFLNRSVVVEQTSRLMTGNTLPRLQTEDIENLLIPIPNEATQKKIVAEVKRIYHKATNLRIEAENIINKALKQTAELIF